MRKGIYFCFAATWIVLLQSAITGQNFKLDESNLELIVGSPPKTLIATVLTPDTFEDEDDLTWIGNNGFVEISKGVLSSDKRSLEFTLRALKAIDNLKLTARSKDLQLDLPVTIFPEISATTLQFSPSLTSSQLTEGIEITKGGKKTFSLTLKDNLRIPVTALSIESDSNAIARGGLKDNLVTIEASDVGATVIRIKAYGNEINTLRVRVHEGVDFSKIPSEISIQKGSIPVDLAAKIGVDLSKLIIGSPVDSSIAEIRSNSQIVGMSSGKTSFEVALKDDPEQEKTIYVEVTPKAVGISFPNLDTTKSLIVGSPIFATALVEADDGNRIESATVRLTSSNQACISVTPRSGNSFSIEAESPTCAPVTLTATAEINGQTITQLIQLAVSQVKGFSPLEIRLDLIDHRLAKDLFGSKTADEFHIAKARLFNKIGEDKANPNSFWRNPILVYSESLSVKVAIQLKCDDGLRPCPPDESKWHEWDESRFKTTFPNGFRSQDSESCKVSPQTGYFFPYRPLVFEMITSTQDSRSDRSTRHKVMTTINGLSSAASFITSIAVPGAGSDLPLGLDKFQNLLIPSIERLFPSMRESHRQNVIRWAMHPLEEIAFGSDITKVIFFPRGPIKGMVPGYLVRITGISISDSCAEVALIQKVTNL